MTIPSDIRIPFIPLSLTRSNIAIPRELMIDYEKGLLYYKSKNGKKNILIGRDSTIEEITNNIKELYGDVSSDYNSLFKIREILRDIESWKNGLMLPDDNSIVDTIVELLDKFSDMSNDSETLKQKIDLKQSKVTGKDLSEVDFSDEYLDKLNNIEYEANNYIHSNLKECAYEPAVKSVNSKTGAVIITPADLGLQNLDPNAIKYEHPAEKQCNIKAVVSLNNKVDAVTLSKNDFELDNLTNYSLAYGGSLLSSTFSTNNQYLSPNGLFNIFNEYIHSNPSLYTNKYIGFVKELITGASLSSLCGISTGTLLVPSDISWSKFFYMGNIIYYSNNIVRSNVSWDALNSSGLIDGKIITINGKRYKCRLIESGIRSYSSIFYKGEMIQLSKSDKFSDIKSEMISTSSEFWCKDVIVENGVKMGFTSNRGIITESAFTSRTPTLSAKDTTLLSGWRPVLELLDYVTDTSSSVTFVTNPSDAIVKVLINGSWVTGNSHTLQIGVAYRYIVTKTGYIESDSIITPIKSTQVVNVNLTISPPREYMLTILTTPTDAIASVNINGEWKIGKVHYLTNGVYSYKVTRPGYDTVTSTTTISNANNELNITLVNPNEILLAASGYLNTIFLLKNGKAKGVGRNSDAELGLGYSSYDYEVIMKQCAITGIKHVESTGSSTFFILNDGTVKACGNNNMAVLGLGYDTYNGYVAPLTTVPISNVKQIVGTGGTTLFLMNDGTVKGVGYNGYGILGTAQSQSLVTSIISIPITNVKQIAVGHSHALFLMNDGTVKGVGYNNNGELGLGFRGDPVKSITNIPISNVKAISAGANHSMFLMNDGTVKAVGRNYAGQLGLGPSYVTERIVDIQTVPISNVKSIYTSNSDNTVFLLNDGTVKAVGYNGNGILGTGSTANYLTTITSIPISNVKSISIGYTGIIFILNDGTIKAVGGNTKGQLGLGKVSQIETTPVEVTII